MKAAIIGAGPMGLRHARAVEELGIELVAVCDVREDARAKAAEQTGLEAHAMFPSADALFAAVRPEIAIIATNAASHCELTCLAAERGAKHILCEKPMAVSLAESDRMIEACRATGARLAVNQPARFNGLFRHARDVVRSKAFGGLRSMTVVAGNEGMAMNGIHLFEAFRFITGEAFAEVSAWFSPEQPPNPRGQEFEDHAGALRAVTSSGKRFFLECGSDQGHGQLAIYGGGLGQLCVNHLTGEAVLHARKPEDRHLPSTRWSMPTTVENVKLAPVDVVECVKEMLGALLDGANYVDGAEARQTIEILLAANLSHEMRGAPVELDGRLPRERTFAWA